MNRIKSVIRSLSQLIIEMRLSYYRWCLGNINKAMALAKKQVDESDGILKCWASEDLLELAEDRIAVNDKIRQLQRLINHANKEQY